MADGTQQMVDLNRQSYSHAERPELIEAAGAQGKCKIAAKIWQKFFMTGQKEILRTTRQQVCRLMSCMSILDEGIMMVPLWMQQESPTATCVSKA